jgi:subtilisin family serine protease
MTLTVRALLQTTGVLAACLTGALPAVPANAAEFPSPQAELANASFLATAPPPPNPVKVCVVDTGVDLNTDVAPAVVERYDVGGGPVDDLGGAGLPKHGTYVAGVIASALDGQGSVGVWPHAQIVSVRVFTSAGTNYNRYLLGLDRCRERRVSVVNLSLGGLSEATAGQLEQIENRIRDLRDNRGINVVAAAGNSGGLVTYPARFPAAFSVGAADAADNTCSFSSRGAALDVWAFGCGTTLSLAGGASGRGDGTSFAAPVVSGVLAALRAYRPELTPVEAESFLLSSGRAAASGLQLDAAASFRAAGLGNIVSGPTSAPTPSPFPGPTNRTEDAVPPQHSRVVVAPFTDDPVRELGVRRPRLRKVSYRKLVLQVDVRGVPEFARAVFKVDGRIYRRATGRLRVRLKRKPRSIEVRIEIPEIGVSPPLRVRLPGGNSSASRRG